MSPKHPFKYPFAREATVSIYSAGNRKLSFRPVRRTKNVNGKRVPRLGWVADDGSRDQEARNAEPFPPRPINKPSSIPFCGTQTQSTRLGIMPYAQPGHTCGRASVRELVWRRWAPRRDGSAPWPGRRKLTASSPYGDLNSHCETPAFANVSTNSWPRPIAREGHCFLFFLISFASRVKWVMA